jgi:hypothetical protein
MANAEVSRKVALNQGVDVNTKDLCDHCSREIEDPLYSRFTLFPKLEVIQCQS